MCSFHFYQICLLQWYGIKLFNSEKLVSDWFDKGRKRLKCYESDRTRSLSSNCQSWKVTRPLCRMVTLINYCNMKLYQYLFYKFYSLSKLMETGNIVSAANAYFMVSILLGLNILTIMCIVNLLLGKIIFSGIGFYILLFCPLVFVYYASLHKQKT
jgi:hypothetical protein